MRATRTVRAVQVRGRSAAVVAVLVALAAPTAGRAATATQVSIGAFGQHGCALDSAGGAWCWGRNNLGQVGDGTTDPRTAPVGVTGLSSGVASIEAGGQHTCAVTSSGGAACWGSNGDAQLGDGSTTSSSVPVDVSGLTSGVAGVSAGSQHSCALTTGGGVKCWGKNQFGALGDGTTNDSSVPVDVVGLDSGVAAVSAGRGFSCALLTGGGVKCWGRGNNGQLGTGTAADSSVPVDVVGLTTGAQLVAGASDVCAILQTTGTLLCWGGMQSGTGSVPYAIGNLPSGVTAVALGGYIDNLAVTATGAVRSFRLNSGVGAVELPGLQSGFAGVAAADAHFCALTLDGEIKCWGHNANGELGEASTASHTTAGCVVGFGDSDADRICDADDPCTSGASFATAPKPRMVLSRIYQDPVPGDDRLQLRARIPLPPTVGFADLDLIGGGARLAIVDPGGLVIDRTLPAGAYGGLGTAGWFTNSLMKSWTFMDATSGKVETRLTIVDKGRGLPGGAVDVTLTRKNDDLTVAPLQLPLRVLFVLGDAAAGADGVCGQSETSQLACKFNSNSQSTLVCRQL